MLASPGKAQIRSRSQTLHSDPKEGRGGEVFNGRFFFLVVGGGGVVLILISILFVITSEA